MSSARLILDSLKTQDQRQAIDDVFGKGTFQKIANLAAAEEAEEPNEWDQVRQSVKTRQKAPVDPSIERRRAVLLPDETGR